MDAAIILSVLTLGFLGSWHCGAMCGPIACGFKKGKDFSLYHAGRLISYMAMATIIFAGRAYFAQVSSREVQMTTTATFVLVFVFFGLRQMGILRFNFQIPRIQRLHFYLFKLIKFNKAAPFLMGGLTGFFPCMWLYSYLFLAGHMRSLHGAWLVVFLFWMTSLPVFMVFNGSLQALIRHSPISHQKISGFVLIMAGVFSVAGHWAHVLFL